MRTRPLALAAALALPAASRWPAAPAPTEPPTGAVPARPDRGQGQRHRVRGLAHRGPRRHGGVHDHQLRQQGQRVLRLRRGRPDHGRGRERRPRPDPHLPRRPRPSRAPTRPPASRGWWATASAPPFTVTGASAAAKSDDENLKAAVTEYQRYVASQSDAFLAETTAFVALVKAGKVDEAKALYPTARSYWERIEPVAESFGDLDPKIDGRAEVVDEGMEFTGYHRLEKDLWEDGLQPDSSAIADQLLADVTELVDQGQGRRAQPAPAGQRLQGPARRDRHRQDHRRGGALQPHRPVGLRGQLRGVQVGHRGPAPVPPGPGPGPGHEDRHQRQGPRRPARDLPRR